MDLKEFFKPNRKKLEYFLLITIPLLLLIAAIHYFLYQSTLNSFKEISYQSRPIGRSADLFPDPEKITNGIFLVFWFLYPVEIIAGYAAACYVYWVKEKNNKGELKKITMKQRLILLIVLFGYWIPVIASYYLLHIEWIMPLAPIIWLLLFYFLLKKMKIY